MFARQTLIFGPAGQALLNSMHVGIIGAGGVGSLLVEYLARLGVGHIITADPDYVELSNLPRLVGATRGDAGWPLAQLHWTWARQLARRISRSKVAVAGRVARQANRDIYVEGIVGDIADSEVAARFTDCDFLFLAADSMQARLVFNAIAHQYLIPGIQLGSKVTAHAETGQLIDVFSVERPLVPDYGCLWCNQLILASKLQDEAASETERKAQRYVIDSAVTAPSVITLNAVAAAHAANDFLFWATGLMNVPDHLTHLLFRARERQFTATSSRRDAFCLECGLDSKSRLARGDGRRLPTRLRT
jgi:molybdopterin/thiamine biosynthesis adenylyltransferase